MTRAALARPGIGVRLALREPADVRTTLVGPAGGVVAEHRFPTAVTALTALRLTARGLAAGSGYRVVIRVRPTAGADAVELRRPLIVT